MQWYDICRIQFGIKIILKGFVRDVHVPQTIFSYQTGIGIHLTQGIYNENKHRSQSY